MPGRAFRSDSRNEQFVRRVPRDVVERVRGRFVVFEFPSLKGEPASMVSTTLGEVVSFSLRTANPEVAEARRALAIAHLERVYDSARNGPRKLDQIELDALAGAAYQLIVQQFERNPGTPDRWAAFKAFTRAIKEGRINRAPAIRVDGTLDEVDEARAVFGDDLTTGIDALPRSEHPAGYEARFGTIVSWVLTKHGCEVDAATRLELLTLVADAVLDAGWRMKRAAQHDRSPDPKESRFPPISVLRDRPAEVTITGLLDAWAKEKKPVQSTLDQWRKHVASFAEFVGHDDARRVGKADVVAWKDALFEAGGSPKTINDSKLAAVKKAFAWGVKNERLTTNPASGISVDAPKKKKMLGFSEVDAEIILAAAAQSKRRAIRWVPLLCATSGARVSEMAQLRAEDVFQRDGMHVMKLTDEGGGSLKNANSERVIPIHSAVINAGFLDFVQGKQGPLFYGSSRRNPKATKRSAKIVADNVADWARGLGIEIGRKHRKDSNHAWRHRFSTVAREADVSDSVIKLIRGSAPDSVSAGYGTATLQTMQRAIERIPVPAPGVAAPTSVADLPSRAQKRLRDAASEVQPVRSGKLENAGAAGSEAP